MQTGFTFDWYNYLAYGLNSLYIMVQSASCRPQHDLGSYLFLYCTAVRDSGSGKSC